ITRGVRPSPWQAVVRSTSTVAPKSKRGTRNAERGTARSGPVLGVGPTPRRPHALFRVPNSAFRILSLAERQQVRKQPIRARDPRRQLPEEAQPGIPVPALAHRRDEQSTLERQLAGIVQLDERRVGGIPIVREIQSPLLHPATPVVRPV